MMNNKRPNINEGGPARKIGSAAPSKVQDDEDAMMMDEAIEDFEAEQEGVMMPPDEAEEVDLGEAGRNWMRPAVSADFDPKTSPLGRYSFSVQGLKRGAGWKITYWNGCRC